MGSTRQGTTGRVVRPSLVNHTLVRPQRLPRHDNQSQANTERGTSLHRTLHSSSTARHQRAHFQTPISYIILQSIKVNRSSSPYSRSHCASCSMKHSLVLAATALAGSACAGIHRMKLQKIPFDQQLVCPLSLFTPVASLQACI